MFPYKGHVVEKVLQVLTMVVIAAGELGVKYNLLKNYYHNIFISFY